MATDETQSGGLSAGANEATKKLAQEAIQKQLDVVKYCLLGFFIFIIPLIGVWLLIVLELLLLPSFIPSRIKPWRISLLRKIVYYVSVVGIPIIILLAIGLVGYIFDFKEGAIFDIGDNLGGLASEIIKESVGIR